MTMDFNAYRQDRVKAMLERGAMSDRDRQMLNNNMANDYRRYAMQQQGGRMSDNDMQRVNNAVNNMYNNGGQNTQIDLNSVLKPQGKAYYQYAKQLEGSQLNDNDIMRLGQAINKIRDREPVFGQKYVDDAIRQYAKSREGVLTQSDIEALNKIFNPNSFKMPTYQDIFNYITNAVGQ